MNGERSTFENDIHNATAGTCETARVTVTADGRAPTDPTNVSIEVCGEDDVDGDSRADSFDAVVIGRNWRAEVVRSPYVGGS